MWSTAASSSSSNTAAAAAGGDSKAFLAKKVVSGDGPKPDEVRHEATLLRWCQTCIEPEEEANRRRAVLERIHHVVRLWIRQTMISEFHMPDAVASQVEGRLFATGSYRYNVHTSGSDIDMVLIAPNRMTHDHFFRTLAPRLRQEPWVSELHCVRDSRVPIIAMVCDGIDIDLSFGAIRQDRVPEVITDDLLQGLDEASVLSCNAVRVAHNIMDLVPNKATFRQTLRFVKAWGKARNIYSNTFGFPSGIGWAILVAFVCQCYPRQNAAGAVARFFRTYHAWFRPNPHESGVDNRAIYLTESMRARTHLGRCWDPRESRADAMALLPVLTPALPYSNACYNVTLTNLRQLCDEWRRGHELVSAHLSLSVAEAQQRFGAYGIWSKLLEPVVFFGAYAYYLHVAITCHDAEQYQAYADGVESRIRVLWAGNASSRGQTLEDYKQLRLHLNPRRFEHPDEVARRARALRKSTGGSGATTTTTNTTAPVGDATSSYTAHYFIGMEVDTTVSQARIDLAPAIRVFHAVVRQLRQYHEGVTRLPAITVCDMRGVPDFVKDAVGYTEAATAAAAETTTTQDAAAAAHDATAAAADAPSSSHAAGDGAATTTTTAAATRTSTNDDDNGSSDVVAGGAAATRKRERDAASSSSSSSKKDNDSSSLEQALGLDF